MKSTSMSMVRRVVAAAVAGLAAASAAGTALAAGEAGEIKRQKWTFGGLFGHFDRAQLQRGYQVYSEVCATCHGITRIAFRNLAESGGPEFPIDAVKGLAASFKIEDGPNEQGKMFQRPGRLSDRFPPPYKNEQEARATHNGAYPPDLSLITRARNVEYHGPLWFHPLSMLWDVVIGYQEGGADYLYALLTGYGAPPAYVRDAAGHLVRLAPGQADAKAERCVSVVPGKDGKPDVCNQLLDGMHYNAVFPGGQIAMIPPLQDGRVAYGDGTPPTVHNYAADVSAFLSWAADPTLEERKQLGWQVLLYLLVTTVLLYVAKRRIWSNIPH
ncbi:MAG TPA: cytochrome c1 [Hyphomicrobiaceae bacterium]|nr:cytochrome c1 [Hyphomicrobiaceae bacterium]